MTVEDYGALVDRYVHMSDAEFQRLLAHLNSSQEVNDDDERSAIGEARLIREGSSASVEVQVEPVRSGPVFKNCFLTLKRLGELRRRKAGVGQPLTQDELDELVALPRILAENNCNR